MKRFSLILLALLAAAVVHAQTHTVVTYEGAWSSTPTYIKSAVVTEAGSTYVSVQSGNINHDPASDTGHTWWAPLPGGTTFNGGTVANPITLPADPAQNLQAATKQYVDTHAGSSAITSPTYTFYVSGGTVYAVNGQTQHVDYSGTDAAFVINQVLSALASTGGTLYFKNGTYNLNSCTMETVSPYTTLCYAVGIPAGTATVYPNFNFMGESAAIGSQANPAATGVIFNVTSTALTAAGSNTLAAFWMRPDTNCDAEYTWGCLYWNDHVSFENLAINFPDSTRGKEYAIDAIEASYLHLRHVQAGFLTFPSALGAGNLTAFKTPATPSDGVLIEETQVGPGWDIGYEVNTEHSVLVNTEVWRATNCYVYGGQLNRNSSPIYHSSQFIHPQIYDCPNGIQAGTHIKAGAQLDILGLDQQYATTGIYALSYTFHTGANLGGWMSWGSISDGGTLNGLASPFDSGGGSNYSVESNGAISIAGAKLFNWFGGGVSLLLPTAGPSNISVGSSAGTDVLAAYVSSAAGFFANAVAGDFAYRNTHGSMLFGTSSNGAANLRIDDSGNVLLNADPTLPLGAATKQYVDSHSSGSATPGQINVAANLSGTQTFDPYGYDLAWAHTDAAVTLAAPHGTGETGTQQIIRIANFGSHAVTITGSSLSAAITTASTNYCPSGCIATAYTITANHTVELVSNNGGWNITANYPNQ